MEYVIVLAIVVIFLVFKDRPVMMLKFEGGELIQSKGNIPNGFLIGCKDIAHKQPFPEKSKYTEIVSQQNWCFPKRYRAK